ncbi:hypothetical protein [Chitinophaga pinensis]|uniref:Holin n=1 Tax=Chitinophaga pinensis (strain ATCC 43595 / DSM 2588 / LMG 13176 / NBRC 15968 / NCIMB 11800 / UQM 2034) TaxID=485918 RepID=A0A979GXR9_CHIPD|nr:hypothetical protein [Chitinophaga pinensis]ACU61370.1 hypothetical protein Cpin_3908 [Chitinophaga pinensis DSM 2588]
MATTVFNNLKQASPPWLVNLTAIFALAAPLLPELIDTMPGTVSNLTKEWLHWILQLLAAAFAIATALTRASTALQIRTYSDAPPDGPGGTDPNKPRGPK